MAIQIDTIEGPSFLASALINGDKSGFSDGDNEVLQQFLGDLPKDAYIVDCSEQTWFGRWHGIGHDLCEYTYHIQAD